jgi:hypothetical protein
LIQGRPGASLAIYFYGNIFIWYSKARQVKMPVNVDI